MSFAYPFPVLSWFGDDMFELKEVLVFIFSLSSSIIWELRMLMGGGDVFGNEKEMYLSYGNCYVDFV